MHLTTVIGPRRFKSGADPNAVLEQIWEKAQRAYLRHDQHPPIFFVFQGEALYIFDVRKEFCDPDRKAAVSALMHRIGRDADTDAIALVSEAWLAIRDPGAPPLSGEVRDAPNACEVLMVNVETRNYGDAFRVAEIVRTERSLELRTIPKMNGPMSKGMGNLVGFFPKGEA